MDLRQAEEYLLGLELFGMRFGLDRMHKLMTALGMPQRRFASIHVVGTNGKSSTVRMTAAILRRHGLRTGTYTSPHLRSFAERIEIDERPVSSADFGAAVARAAHAAELVERTLDADDRVTQFEALTAAAYHELARRRVEVAVIEAGLGGRFDATSVIPSKVQVLTGVGLEHTRWLGPTIADIAAEKLAVVPDRGCLVAGQLHPEAEAVAREVIAARHARRVRAGKACEGQASTAAGEGDGGKTPHEGGSLSELASVLPREGSSPRPHPPLKARGGFQRENFALACAAAEAFLGRELDEAAVRAAAAEIEIPGRLQVVSEAPLVVYDAAHNPSGARALAEALPEVVGDRRLTAVIAILDDKDAAGMLAALVPLCERAVYTRCANPRSLSPATLESLAGKVGGPPSETVADPRAAVEHARGLAGTDGAVVVTGSIYLIADLVRDAGAARASAL